MERVSAQQQIIKNTNCTINTIKQEHRGLVMNIEKKEGEVQGMKAELKTTQQKVQDLALKIKEKQ